MKTLLTNVLIPVLVCGALISGCSVPIFSSPTPTTPAAAFTWTASPSPAPAASSTATLTFTTSPIELPPSIVSPTPAEDLLPTVVSPVAPLTITILYNNIPFDARLKTDWGFSALVEYRGGILLFDTGRDGQILLHNMQVLSIDPARIQYVVLSHIHSDHTGGLDALLEVAAQPSVYLLPSFGDAYNQGVQRVTEGIEVTPGQPITEYMLTTGEISGAIPEQALIVRTPAGLIIVAGCAHPGIVRVIERAVELTGEPVYLVLGGFHLGDKSEAELAAIIRDFRQLGVQKVAPSHCTGEQAINMFAAEYGMDFLRTGVGSVINVEISSR
ncbi:MAG: MBL fold metallo-hydrolase [Chloroflexi bacterium]|nr:MBL fold metallo-hydrolase [Chloroflexota bacterium]